MKTYVIIAIVAAAATFLSVGSSTGTVSADHGPNHNGCITGPLAQNGVFTLDDCNQLQDDANACIAKLRDTLPSILEYRIADAQIWFANVDFAGVNYSLFCRALVGLSLGITDCSNFQPRPGINPDADQEACAAWRALEFSIYNYVWPDPEGRDGVVCTVRGCGNYAVQITTNVPPRTLLDVINGVFHQSVSARPVPVVPPSVTLLPPNSGSGGLLAGGGVGAYVAVATAFIVAYAGIGLGVAKGLAWTRRRG